MAITDPTMVTTTTVVGTHITLAAGIQATIQLLSAGTEIIDISVVRHAVGNKYTAYITYEAPVPSP